jgi:alkylhydroperoxidase family enzyme
LRRAKVPEEKIAALLVSVLDKAQFTEPELVALELADRMAESGHAVSNELYERLRAQFDEGEIIELACVIGLFNYFNRVNDALRTEITR